MKDCVFYVKEVEDETHFLFHCEYYQNLRQKYFENVDFTNLTISEKFVLLFNRYIKKTARFLTAAYLKRRSFIYNV